MYTFIYIIIMSIELLIKNDEEEAIFNYLFDLEENGTNMFGAAALIIRQPQFSHISLLKAHDIVIKWMENLDKLKMSMARETIILK